MKLRLLFLVVLLFASLLSADSEPDYYQLAMKAYEARNYQECINNLLKVVRPEGPNPPRVMYNLACAYSLNGDSANAAKWLGKIADLGIYLPAEKDTDFDPIKDKEEFQAVLRRLTGNLTVRGNAKTAFETSENDFLAEGIVFDEPGKKFYLGSIHQRKIMTRDEKGKWELFASEKDGLWSVLGMAIDAPRRRLWVTATASAAMSGFQESDKGKAGLFLFDLKSGKVLRKIQLETPGAHAVGDVIVNASGDAFTTDSMTPALFRVAADGNELKQIAGADVFRSPQGLCFFPDEKKLFVADYVRGIFAVDPRTGAAVALPYPVNAVLSGIDGLYCYKDSLVATQNGTTPRRVLRLRLSTAQDRIERVEVLQSGHEAFGEPTLGTIKEDVFYFVANNPTISDLLENAQTTLRPSVILEIRLE